MSKFTKLAALALGVATVAGFVGEAQAYSLYTKNNSKNAIWITIYLYGSHNGKQDYYCILPGQEHKSDKWAYGNVGDGVYVRAEVKKETNTCGNSSNKYDMTTGYVTVSSSNRSMVTYSSSRVGDQPSVNTAGWH